MKKTLIAAIALFSMTACNVQVIETPSADEYGYINLGIAAETEIVTTKAALDADALASYEIILIKDENTVWTKEYKDIRAEDLKVSAGTYTLIATNLSEKESYSENNDKGAVRVSGTQTVGVTSGTSTSCDIQCNPINSKVSFKYTENFKTVFPTITSLTVAEGERVLNMTALQSTDESSAADVAYFEAERTLTWNLTAKNTQNTDKTYSKEFQTKANKWTVITFDVSGTDGEFTITVEINDEISTTDPITEIIDPFTGE